MLMALYYLLFVGLGILFVGLGVPLVWRRVPPNPWYGLRVPATAADETVWYEANAAMAREFMAFGAASALLALALPRLFSLPEVLYLLIGALWLLVGALVLSVRGWRLANRLLANRKGAEPNNRIS